MATNLLIAFPDIPVSALTVTAAGDGRNGKPYSNLFWGKRSQGFIKDGSATSWSLVFDLGTGNTKAVDHIIIARADELSVDITDVDIDSSPDGSAWTERYADSSFSSATLRGPDSEDYAEEITETSAFRYWRVRYNGSADLFQHSKLYFGTFFDIGKEPESFRYRYNSSSHNYLSSDGTRYYSSNDGERLAFDFVWTGLSNDITESFIERLLDRRKRYCFLYAKSDERILAGNKVLHCEVDQNSVTFEKVYHDYNMVSASFVQMLG